MRLKEFDWAMIIFLGSYHILLLILLPVYLLTKGVPGYGIILATIGLYIFTGLGVSMGYHRLYAHKAYKINKFVEGVVVFFATLSLQGSILRWGYKHRLHHKYVDTDKDPYSIKKGFLYAHLLWMFEKQKEDLESDIVKDLRKNRLLMFQHKYNVSLMVMLNILSIIFFGFLFKDFLGSIVFVFLLRTFAVHHSTFFINSLAHTWGAKPYSKEQTAVNNWILAFLTFGEGYHNYHHTYPADYRNGVRWWQFDPTKLLVWGISKMSLAEDLVKVDKYGIKRKLITQDKKLILEKFQELSHIKWEEFEERVNELSDSLIERFDEINKLKRKLKALKLEMSSKELFREVKIKRREMRRSIRRDMRVWKKLCAGILELKPQLI
jgi:stearoyl-CoA desaturase (Delta-9 desaturase)